jgi:hypothetical protein
LTGKVSKLCWKPLMNFRLFHTFLTEGCNNVLQRTINTCRCLLLYWLKLLWEQNSCFLKPTSYMPHNCIKIKYKSNLNSLSNFRTPQQYTGPVWTYTQEGCRGNVISF